MIASTGVAGRSIAGLIGDDTEVVVDDRSRQEAIAAIAREDDFVLMPARPGGPPFHRDAAAAASLSVECSVGVPVRPHARAAVVTGTPTLVGQRAS